MNDKFELSQRFKAKDDIFPGELGAIGKIIQALICSWIFQQQNSKMGEYFLSFVSQSKSETENSVTKFQSAFDGELFEKRA